MKLSGYRIELGEVEAAVLSHPDVCAAVVVISGSGDEQTTDRVLRGRTQGRTLPPDTMRAYLAQRLPHYMVPVAPGAWWTSCRSPRTGRSTPRRWPAVASGESTAPRRSSWPPGPTPSERSLMDLGGAAPRGAGGRDGQLLRTGRAVPSWPPGSCPASEPPFGVRVTMREFFDNPTVDGLARLVAQRGVPEQSPAVVASWGSE